MKRLAMLSLLVLNSCSTTPDVPDTNVALHLSELIQARTHKTCEVTRYRDEGRSAKGLINLINNVPNGTVAFTAYTVECDQDAAFYVALPDSDIYKAYVGACDSHDDAFNHHHCVTIARERS